MPDQHTTAGIDKDYRERFEDLTGCSFRAVSAMSARANGVGRALAKRFQPFSGQDRFSMIRHRSFSGNSRLGSAESALV
jgi:hypothetical protein